LQQRLALRVARVVLAFGIDERETRLNCVELVLADSPVDDLFRAGGAVERPTRAVLLQREREGPVVAANLQRRHAFGAAVERMPGLVRMQESLAGVAVADRIAGIHYRRCVRSEHFEQCVRVLGLGSSDERLSGLLGRGEVLLRNRSTAPDHCSCDSDHQYECAHVLVPPLQRRLPPPPRDAPRLDDPRLLYWRVLEPRSTFLNASEDRDEEPISRLDEPRSR
jgi:hypothetical protein